MHPHTNVRHDDNGWTHLDDWRSDDDGFLVAFVSVPSAAIGHDTTGAGEKSADADEE